MPDGLEHVGNALALIVTASAALESLGDADWRAEVEAKLAASADLLSKMGDRFFLKSRLCLPFARRCEEAAQKLADLLSESGEVLAPDAGSGIRAAADALVKATKTLEERSLMQGMAIT